jgi:hypothetical protein
MFSCVTYILLQGLGFTGGAKRGGWAMLRLGFGAIVAWLGLV